MKQILLNKTELETFLEYKHSYVYRLLENTIGKHGKSVQEVMLAVCLYSITLRLKMLLNIFGWNKQFL